MIPISTIRKELKEEKPLFLDLNCDLGQSFGVYKNDSEFDLLPYVSSVNISCGAHAGDPLTIMKALKKANDNNLSIGAHIGYPDLQGFGYRAMQLSDEEIQAIVLYQIGALSSMAKSYNVEIDHVRPHGALYKQAAEDFNVSLSIANAIKSYNPWLIYVGAAGENIQKVAQEANIKVAQEIHLDKKYKMDGSIDFEAGDIANFQYSVKLLETLVNESSVINEVEGKTKVEFSTIHLSLKSQYSLGIANKTKELIKNPAPITVSSIKDTSWIN